MAATLLGLTQALALMKALSLACLLFLASGISNAADFDYGSYKDSSIASAGSNLGIAAEVTWWLDAAHPKFHTVATYTGNSRPITAETKELIRHWEKAMQHKAGTSDMFASEIEVEQDGSRYWLPIQSQLVKPLSEEIHPGQATHLYILLVGAYKQAPVFIVNEFNLAEG